MSTVVLAAHPEARPHPRTMRVALAGCGVVGGQLVALLREHGAAIERSRGVRIEIVRILVRDTHRPRAVPLAPDLLTADVNSFSATRADIVVEALGGSDPAERIAWSALAAGRDFITANKALVARSGVALHELARRSRARFAFEAAVAGGVPVLRVLRDALVAADVHAVRGILNGTTNYILGRMRAGDTFGTALAAAQAHGFAEADPTRDLDGRDAADKLAILAWLAFGVDPATVHVRRTGLLPDPDALAAAAHAYGAVVRLVAECVRLPGGVVASVAPVIVGATSRFAAVHGADNLVEIDSGWSGSLRFAGAGAGGAPTATALLGDILAAPAPIASHAVALRTDVEDPRLAQWVLSVRTAERDRVIDVCGAAGIDVAAAPCAFGAIHVLTARCLDSEAARAGAALAEAGFTTVRSRYDVAQETSAPVIAAPTPLEP